MANLTPKLLYIGAATASNVYTVSNLDESYSIVKNINICNVTSNSATCSLHLILSGQSVADNNAVLKSFIVSPNETISYTGAIVLPPDSSLYLSQASASITLSISGVEYVAGDSNNN
jgi:hypothetical protein